MIKILRKTWVKFLSIFDKEFVARALNIHHPSEYRKDEVFAITMNYNYNTYSQLRFELKNFKNLAHLYGCETADELDKVIKDLMK
ncbi:MAG: hypothetical protein SPL21_10075 [Fibrobacter sp.]|nr:hypothetical protein [Fibrobacter sp.]